MSNKVKTSEKINHIIKRKKYLFQFTEKMHTLLGEILS